MTNSGMFVGAKLILILSIACFVFLVVGFSFRSSGLKEQRILEELKRGGEKTTGVIVYAEDGHTEVEYQDEDGESYIIAYNFSSSTLCEGKKVTVYYNRKHPENAVAKELGTDFMIMFGTIFMVVGLVAFIGLAITMCVCWRIIAKKRLQDEQNNLGNSYINNTQIDNYDSKRYYSGISKDF